MPHAQRRRRRSRTRGSAASTEPSAHSPLAQIQAVGKVARAMRYGTGPSRRAALGMAVVTAIAMAVIVVGAIIDSVW